MADKTLFPVWEMGFVIWQSLKDLQIALISVRRNKSPVGTPLNKQSMEVKLK